jgi:cytochrome b6-f complex iron-sulfur subunit
MADKKKMSVEDILAACRGQAAGTPADAAQGSEADAPRSAAAASSESTTPADAGNGDEAVPAAAEKPQPTAKPAKAMSIEEILAAARGQGAPAKAKAKPAAAPKTPAAKAGAPATKPATAKPSPSGAAAKTASQPAGPMDTSSILAAARGGARPGPVSKSQAAARAPVPKKPAPAKPTVPPMPAKPTFAAARTEPAERTDRRGFFSYLFGSSLALGFTSLGFTSALWSLGMARFMFPNILIEPPSRFKVGFPSDFAPDTVADKFKAQFGVWIVNTAYQGQPSIVALKTVCTHLGCTPNWLEAEQKFKCPCHGSGFYKDGINFEGPAPRPLERYAIRVADDGQLEIDKSKTFQQEMGQWSDTASFVAV